MTHKGDFNMKKLFVLFALAFVFVSALSAADAVKPANPHITAYYFHAWLRNQACQLFEDTLKKTISETFKKEYESGKIIMEVYDVEKGEAHFTDDYELVASNAIVLSLVKDGKEVKWVELKKLIPLSEDPVKLRAYLEKEIRAFMAEDGKK